MRILVVDESETIHEEFRRILACEPDVSDALRAGGADQFPSHGTGFEVTCAHSGSDCVRLIHDAIDAHARYSVAFVDVRQSAAGDGIDAVLKIWGQDPDIQIVICTTPSDYSWNEIVARLGNNDRLLLLIKPFNPAEVWQLASALSEKWSLVQSDRAKLLESLQLTEELQQLNGNLRREIDERKSVEEKLRHSAYHDALTGLPNRAYLMEYANCCLSRAAKSRDYRFAMLFIDLDNFKLVNDSQGHAAGDALLIEVARRLTATLRSLDSLTRLTADAATRLGGDEFVVVLDGLQRSSDVGIVAQRLLERLAEPFEVGGQPTVLGASIGITISGPSYSTADDMLRDADTAMYRAKSGGKARYAIFDPEMHAAMRRRLALENDLRRALSEAHFSLKYQPIVGLRDGRIVAVEALLRWEHPDYELRVPSDFIPVAEEMGIISPLGDWVISQACCDIGRLRRALPEAERLRLNINVACRQLKDPELALRLRRAMEAHGISARQVSLEITESAMIDDFDGTLQRLSELRALGFGLQLDDFGTGYSALSCLHRFPLDVVKIDRAFLVTLESDPKYVAIIQAIISLAHGLDMRVTAEGIEDIRQYELMRKLGCDFGQGYFMARPLSAIDLQRVIAAGGILGRSAEVEAPAAIPG